ncbi:hypothetical protein EWM64_g7123 [Hericium alpestre]|uniref:Uncharacterized protein n=1 Tax=Hericium alpestre TaxID=135208 RepID=A0A4Y9ZSU7_9AGAM|nr:hypothetical protein EWM64_g7123 [Hericium alpestre]
MLYAVRIPESASLRICFSQEDYESLLDQVDDIIPSIGILFNGMCTDRLSLAPFNWVSINEEEFCEMLRIKASHQNPPGPKDLLVEFNWPGSSSLYDVSTAYQELSHKLLALPAFSSAKALEFRCYQGTPTGYLTWETWLAFSKAVAPESLVIYSTRFLRGFLDVYGDHAKGWVSRFHEPGNGGRNGFAGVRNLQVSRVNFRHDDHIYEGRMFRQFLRALQLRLTSESLRKLVVQECKLTQGQVEQLQGLNLEFDWDGRMDGRTKEELKVADESADELSDFYSSDSDDGSSDGASDDGESNSNASDGAGSNHGSGDSEGEEEEEESGGVSGTDTEVSATASDVSVPYT